MITFEAVSKSYPDGTLAVDNLNLECPSGKITVFVGTSGCGKTTSLRMINRLTDPSSGTIRLNGSDILDRDAIELRRGIGYVIQQSGLFPHRTILDNIGTVPHLLGWNKRKTRDRALELMELVGLDPDSAKRYPHQLSGGQQQRVGVARALASDPEVLLMDEPFSAVDPVVRHELQRELMALQTELKKTIIFVTHDIEEAIKLGDQIAVFQTPGKLVQVAPPEELLRNPLPGFVEHFLGEGRGFRWLSFQPATDLPLSDGLIVTEEQFAAPSSVGAGGRAHVLVVDENRQPRGWAKPGDSAVLDDLKTLSLAACYVPGVDSMRRVLDAALISPARAATAVRPDGTVLGTVDQADIMRALAEAQHTEGVGIVQ